MADTEKIVDPEMRHPKIAGVRTKMDLVTIFFIWGMWSACIAYDLLTWRYRGVDTTITYTLRNVAYAYPIISIMGAFVFGMIFGHMFWCGNGK
jgi:hypothetical protein